MREKNYNFNVYHHRFQFRKDALISFFISRGEYNLCDIPSVLHNLIFMKIVKLITQFCFYISGAWLKSGQSADKIINFSHLKQIVMKMKSDQFLNQFVDSCWTEKIILNNKSRSITPLLMIYTEKLKVNSCLGTPIR